MMEHIADEKLALYATGDLAPDDSSAVAAHVENCGGCQRALAELRIMQSFIASSLTDPEAADLLEVRERIAEKLRSRRGSERHWAWWLAGAAAMLALAIVPFTFERPPAIAQFTPPAVLPPQVLPVETPHLRTAVLHRWHIRHRGAGIRSVALITRANQPALIKMTTADPNVVILWQSNQTEDE